MTERRGSGAIAICVALTGLLGSSWTAFAVPTLDATVGLAGRVVPGQPAPIRGRRVRSCNHAPNPLDRRHGSSIAGGVPEAVYHVTCRGNARDKIFLVDPDRELSLDVLGDVLGRFN